RLRRPADGRGLYGRSAGHRSFRTSRLQASRHHGKVRALRRAPFWRVTCAQRADLLSPVAQHQLALPAERMGNDGRQMIALRLPAEHRARAIGRGDDLRWIAPARGAAMDAENTP